MNHASKLFELKNRIGQGLRLRQGKGKGKGKDGKSMNDMIWLVGFVLLYFALQLYILPKLGIPT